MLQRISMVQREWPDENGQMGMSRGCKKLRVVSSCSTKVPKTGLLVRVQLGDLLPNAYPVTTQPLPADY
jgi:hypothetical protein